MSKILKLASVVAVAAMFAMPAAEAAQKHAPGGSTFTFNNGSGGGGARPHIGGGGGNHAYRPNPGNQFPGGVKQHSYNNWNGGGNWNGGNHHRRHRGGYLVYSAPFYGNYYNDSYAYNYSDDDDCRYFWRKYQRTGNPVWKRRYYRCID